MLFFQKWDENTFEYNFLKLVKNNIKDKNKCKIYIGFDFGFSTGINIYYGSQKNNKYALKLERLFKEQNLNVRLVTNIEEDFDLIVLFGYINLYKERKYLKKYKSKILEVISLL